MYYVSHIVEYPIFEPAEGGYYYAGTQIVECLEYESWKEANKQFQKMRKAFLRDYEYDKERIIDRQYGGCGKYKYPCVIYNSRLIGEGEQIQLTRQKPVEYGWHPYC